MLCKLHAMQGYMVSSDVGLQELMHQRAAAMRTQDALDKRDRYLQEMQPYHRVACSEFYEQVS